MGAIANIPQAEKNNFHHLVLDIAWFGLALAATTRFLTVFAIRLGATPTQLGWLAALPAVVLLFSSMMSVRWRRRYPDSVRAIFWPGFGFRLSFLLPAFVPWFPAEWQAASLILAVALPAIPQGVASTIFLTMLREAVYDNHLTALLSRRALALNITVALGALGFGIWLERVRFPLNYQLMFIFAFLATLISLRHVNRVQPLELSAVRDAAHPTVPTRPWQSGGFRRMALIVMIGHIAFFSIFPLIPFHLVENLGASEGFIALFTMVELASAALVAIITRRLIGKLGNRNVLTLAMIGTALSGLIIALSTSLSPTLLGAVLVGLSWTTAGIAMFGLFVENTPTDESSRYSTAYMQIVSLGMFAGPLIGSQLIKVGIDLTGILLLGVGLRLLAALLAAQYADFGRLTAIRPLLRPR